jgi:hypothetical protein
MTTGKPPNTGRGAVSGAVADPIEDDLRAELARAGAEGRWQVVEVLNEQLRAHLERRAGNVVALGARAGMGRPMTIEIYDEMRMVLKRIALSLEAFEDQICSGTAGASMTEGSFFQSTPGTST